jgi:hypothetical protein
LVELNGFIQVRDDTLLLEFFLKATCNVVERFGSARMANRTQNQRCSMELNGLNQVRHDTSLLKSVLKTVGKVIERH